MPGTQKPQQKQTKATQKVGGSAKKPVTKATEGGKGKIAAVKSKTTTRGGSAKGDSVKTYATKPRQHIGGGASKTVKKGPSIKKGGSTSVCYKVTGSGNDTFTVKLCEDSTHGDNPDAERAKRVDEEAKMQAARMRQYGYDNNGRAYG